MKDFVLSLVKSLVDNPETVSIEEVDHGNSYITLTLTVAPEDMGKIIETVKVAREATIKASRALAEFHKANTRAGEPKEENPVMMDEGAAQ